MLFHVLEGAKVVTRSNGVYQQLDVFHRNGELFAKRGSGFIMLRNRGCTSLPDVSWEHVEGVEHTPKSDIGPLLWVDYGK